MNALLAIAADFFEHLTDPAFGRDANDDYALKLQVLMGNDADAAQQLATAPLGRDDVREYVCCGVAVVPGLAGITYG